MQMCCRHWDTRARSWNSGCWRCCVCHPRPKPATRLLWGRVSQQTVFLQDCGFTAQTGALGAASFGGDQGLRLHHFTFLIPPPPAICWEETSVTARGGRYRNCCKPQESSWQHSFLGESSQEMPQAHRAAPSSWAMSAAGDQQHCSSTSHPSAWGV